MLTGTLDDFTLADVFRLLSLAKRTGKLDVERSAGSGRVFFRDGEIYYADSSLTREPLGKKLIRARVVTETQLMKALDQAAAGEGRVGEILVASGVATTEQLQSAVRQQIEDAVFEMLHWDRGKFSWDPKAQADVEIPIAVSVENLIMESSRRLDELGLIKRKIPGEDTVPGMVPSPPEGAVEINITPEEWRILVLIDGRRTVRDISAGSGWDEFTTMRTLYGLVSAGLVEVLGPPSEPGESNEQVPGFDAAALPGHVPVPARAEAAAEAVVEAPEEPPVEEAAISLEPVGEARETSGQIGELPSFDREPPADTSSDAQAEAGPEVGADDQMPFGDDDRPESTGEPFLSDLLRAEPAPEEVDQPADEVSPDPQVTPEPEAAPAVAAVDEVPQPSAEGTPRLEIDKVEMARELSGLFRDDRPARRPLIPGESEDDRPPKPPKAPPVRKRVEDDEQVTKGLISRLIDGVKGL